jgi:membrane protein implicated in regulation of membrane protease activity
MFNAVHRLDFSEYFHWFVLAWTFRGFEMVAITWLLSIAVFLTLTIVAVFLVRRFGRRQGRAS